MKPVTLPALSDPWQQWQLARHVQLHAERRWRQSRAFQSTGTTGTLDGKPMLNFAGNDYLGLSQHPAVKAAAQQAIATWGTGSGASRLITGTRNLHLELEAALADWKHCDAALVLSSGYAANLGVLSSLGGPDCHIFSDSLNHASIIDGCRLARSQVHVYPHLDLAVLDTALAESHGRKLVVSDSVFSMDGDEAPVLALSELCARHGALLLLDEAHAVLGPELPTPGPHVLRMGTLSKALGSLGGFVAGPAPLIQLIENQARSFIYSTALSPADTAAGLAALAICRSTAGEALRQRLRALIEQCRPGHPSPILPLPLGTEQAALAAAAALAATGIYIPAIRPPTVPVGTARLRITLSALHGDAELGYLLQALADLGLSLATL